MARKPIRRRRKKIATEKIESIDRMVGSDADIYGVNRPLPWWTVRPAMKETVRYLMLLKQTIALNQSQIDDLIKAIVESLYPQVNEPDPFQPLQYGELVYNLLNANATAFGSIPKKKFEIKSYDGIPIIRDDMRKKRRKKRVNGRRRSRRATKGRRS